MTANFKCKLYCKLCALWFNTKLVLKSQHIYCCGCHSICILTLGTTPSVVCFLWKNYLTMSPTKRKSGDAEWSSTGRSLYFCQECRLQWSGLTSHPPSSRLKCNLDPKTWNMDEFPISWPTHRAGRLRDWQLGFHGATLTFDDVLHLNFGLIKAMLRIGQCWDVPK